MSNAEPALSVAGLNAWYGESHILQGVDFSVAAGETVAILGRNGVGKSTTLKSIMGLVPRREGSIRLSGKETAALAPHEIARMRVGYCPEDRAIFSTLSVLENLELPPQQGRPRLSTDELYGLFPNLAERLDSLGNRLSGGEQQMLAIARILRSGAELLLLDEPTEGLAPVIIQQIAEMVRRLRALGYTVVVVEQRLDFVLGIADRVIVMDDGRVVDSIEREHVEASLPAITRLLGV